MKKPEKRMKKRSRVRPRSVLAKRIPARLFRVICDHAHRGTVEVRISRKRWQMHEEILVWSGWPHPDTAGQLTSYYSIKINRGQPRIRPNAVVGRMFLNMQDLANNPSEIISHECTHAGMAWARLRRADLNVMPGEEVLCHAVGRLTQQVNRVCYAAKAFGES